MKPTFGLIEAMNPSAQTRSMKVIAQGTVLKYDMKSKDGRRLRASTLIYSKWTGFAEMESQNPVRRAVAFG